jgi:hypothetical protein
MKRALVLAISERTNREWPRNHPLREKALVMSDMALSECQGFLICSPVGEPRLPPAIGDRDVEKSCTRCPIRIVHRASAPPHLIPVCRPCWFELERATAFPIVGDENGTAQ